MGDSTPHSSVEAHRIHELRSTNAVLETNDAGDNIAVRMDIEGWRELARLTNGLIEQYEIALEASRQYRNEKAELQEQFGVEREALRLACRDLQDLHADFGDSRAQTYEPPDEGDVESLMEWLRAKVSRPASDPLVSQIASEGSGAKVQNQDSSDFALVRDMLPFSQKSYYAHQGEVDEAHAALNRIEEQLEVYREFYAAWWDLEKGVIDWCEGRSTRLSEAHAAVIQRESNPASIPPSESVGEARPTGEARSMYPGEADSTPASEPEPELEHDPATGWRKGHEGVWSFRGGEWNRLDVPNQDTRDE